MSNTTSFKKFPSEITEKFLLKLPISDIKQLCAVDAKVSQICSDDGFWRLLVKRDFEIDRLINTDSYKCLYQLLSSHLFIVTETTSYYLPDEGETENDLRPHSFSIVLLTLDQAMEFVL